jgi:hypothetical protein
MLCPLITKDRFGVRPSYDKPTVFPAKNSLVYFISTAYIDHPVWRSHREEAKRGPPSGPRISRNKGVMMSLLLPYAPSGLSLIAGWCVIGAIPRGQPRPPAMMPSHGCEGLRLRRMKVLWTVPQALHGVPTAPPINAQHIARCDYYRARNCLPPQKLRREIQ